MGAAQEKKTYTSRSLCPILSIDRLYTAFVCDYSGDFFSHGESHDMWEMSIIMSGTAGITAGTHVYECKQGDAVIIPGGLFHTAWAMDMSDVRIMTVSFTGEWVSRFVPSGKFSLNERERSIAQLLADALQEICGGKQVHDATFRREDEQIIKNLLELLVLHFNLRREENGKSASSAIGDRFSEIAGYMKAHVCEPLEVDKICSDCNIGRSALNDLFRRYTGSGVIKYYNYLRMRHIIKLLGEGKNMAEIADIMNFSSQNYLSSFFKRETGMTPSQYRTERLKHHK